MHSWSFIGIYFDFPIISFIGIELNHISWIPQLLRIRCILTRVFPNWISASCCCRKFFYRKYMFASIISDYKLCGCLTWLESRICRRWPLTPTIYLCQCWLYHINSCVCISINTECNSSARLINRSCYRSYTENAQSEWPGSCWSLYCIAWTWSHVRWVYYSLLSATIKSHLIRVVFIKIIIIRWCVIDWCTNENTSPHIINSGQWWFLGNGESCQIESSYICYSWTLIPYQCN